MAIEML